MCAYRAPALFVCLVPCLVASAGMAQSAPAFIETFAGITTARALPNGIELRSGVLRMQVTALRDDVLRVRAGRDGQLPEDASWAVLPEARKASATVIEDTSESEIGFHTRSLRVAMSRTSGLLTVFDAAGRVVVQDAAPLRFEGGAFRVSKRMQADEHYFGLGDKTGGLDRRNHAFTLWNTDAYRFQDGTDPIYKSIPFFLTYRAGFAAGVLLDNTWRTSFDFGKELPDRYTLGAAAGPVDYYIVLGPSPQHVVETYAWLTGKPPLPPLWAFGYQQSRYTYTPASRLMEVASHLRDDHIPADALYLDIEFQDRNRPFTIDTKSFPDMTLVVEKLHAMHFRLITIADLHIAKAPGENYAPYESGTTADMFVHDQQGAVYVGSVWPGPSVFPDFTRAQVRTWWGTLYGPFMRMGVDGYWNDMNEPSVFSEPTGTMPVSVVHRIEEAGRTTRAATHAEIHDVYGMENSRATFEGLLKIAPDKRPFVLTRASYAGGQRYAVTWTGDNSSTWSHLRMTTPMLKNLGLSGFAYAGADAGGFAGTPTPELLTKWLQVAAFQPIDRDHTEKGTGDQEPWVGGVEAERVRRSFIETRYRLLPYIYTVAEEASRTGIPMERPVFLDYPDAARDGHPIDLDAGAEAEFLLGHDLLIAPSPYPEAPDTYTVEFPTERWYDYWTGNAVEPPAPVATAANAPADAAQMVKLATRITPALATLPVYVRGGAIVPMQPLVQSTDEKPAGPLTLRVYAGDDCRGSLYADDGTTLEYTRGAYLRMQFRCTVSEDGMQVELLPHEGSYAPWWKFVQIDVFGWKPSQGTVELNGKSAHVGLERAGNSVRVTIGDDGKGVRVLLR